MNHQKGSLKKIGILFLIIGILALFLGILLLIFASFGFWVIISSVVINIISISLLTYKPYE